MEMNLMPYYALQVTPKPFSEWYLLRAWGRASRKKQMRRECKGRGKRGWRRSEGSRLIRDYAVLFLAFRRGIGEEIIFSAFSTGHPILRKKLF